MKVALFVPCYVDQFYPQVAIASLQLLEKLGVRAHFPKQQTCCGQPMANSGCEQDAKPVYHNFVDAFQDYDYVVGPAGSCVYHVRKHFDIIEQTPAVQHVRTNTLELFDFIINVLGITEIPGSFPHKVGLHLSCHGQRGLHQANESEMTPVRDGQLRRLLSGLQGLELTELTRNDECCGFGGTFCVSEAGISARMGQDRVQDHVRNGTQVLTGGDMSCLMHLEGIVRRQKLPVRVLHAAEILNGVIIG
ncbi:(Fe-S)-binding protein [Microvirga sp. STR05]|uniref:(Fe-S)-binding protein n=1 Tax=Hymenobacter duratus TaxID=2771356 RepID=A0ABR8JHW1_9BACT|nr:(Fe-S)-binding protein [Hymenobacter duratus]MBD2716430.1 (Fe-S)-binding protein [Hymenobacter duratus]MBR7951345.1 (Fe-S)-binding protein [Microvirga sp. STR05]